MKNLGKLDNLLKCYLAGMTCKEFAEKYDFSVHTVRKHAKLLGIRPSKYKPTKEHKSKIKNGIKKQLSTEQLNYINKWANKKSRTQIAKDLGISNYLINIAFQDLDIELDQDKVVEFHALNSRKHVQKAIKASSEKWLDEEFSARMRSEMSERSKIKWKSEIYRLKVRNGLRRVYDESDLRCRLSKISKDRYDNDKKVRDILSANRKFKNSKLNDLVALKLEAFGLEYDREFQIANFKFDFKIGNILLEVNGDYWHSLKDNYVLYGSMR
jgi:transposase